MHLTIDDIRPILVIGHRGCRTGYPENTLSAFSAAVAAGADMIELDVTLSADRQVVVIHDDTLDRTTSGSGPVRETSLADLRRLDAGSWFDPRFAGETLPTLDDVLTRIGGEILVNIEIKSSAWEPGAPEDAIERQVVDLISRRGLRKSTLISSFHTGFLEAIAAMAARPEIALITERTAPADTLETCRRLGVFSWHPHYGTLEKAHVEKFHDAGIRIFPYTVNAAADMRRLIRMGVDGLITDDPVAAVSLRKTERAASPSPAA